MIAFGLTQISAAYRTIPYCATVWAEMYRIELYKTGDFLNPWFFILFLCIYNFNVGQHFVNLADNTATQIDIDWAEPSGG